MNNKQSPKYKRFAIIHHYNSPNSAITVDGIEVRRQETVWFAEEDDLGYPVNGRFIVCAPYDNHFLYIDPNWKKIDGRWFALCTCGSPAIIVGANVYKHDGSPAMDSTNKGEMLVCKHHVDFNKHADGSA